MTYIKTNYVDGITPLNAHGFNKNEGGLEQVSDDVRILSDAVTQVDTKVSKKADIVHNHAEYATVSSLNSKVDKEEGKTLSTNDFTTEEKNKLATLRNSDVDKTYVDAELNKKSDKAHTHSDYTTASQVSTMISEAQLGGEVDLSGYATKEDLSSKANINHLHSEYASKVNEHNHENKLVLDNITSAKVSEWNNKSDFSGNYLDLTNLPNIPTVDVTKSYVDTEVGKKANTIHTHSEYAAKSTEHTHDNKVAIDSITSQKIDSWNAKSNADHNHDTTYYTKSQTDSRIDEEIAKAQIGGGEVDLSAYATKEDLKLKSNVGHNHNGDYYTYYEVNEKLATKADKTELHSHANKTDLDGITSAKITEWNNKSTFDGNYDSLKNKPTIPVIDVNKSYVDAEVLKITNQVGNKVDKVSGKGLSTNDFTNALKDKLNGLNPGLDGENGATFTPSVSSDGNLSWTNDKGLNNPTTINIKGQTGKTPNISIGTVTTLSPGQNATVTKRGTTDSPIFDFGIPKGADGTGGGSSSNVIPSITDSPVSNEIFITKTTKAEFTTSGTVSTIEGDSFTIGNTTETDGGSFKATITKAGTIALNLTTKGTRYYLIKTTIGGKYNSTSWLSDIGTYSYNVSPGDTIEISFEDTAASWAGNFEGIQLNDLMWNDGAKNQKINTVTVDTVEALKRVLAGDIQGLAMLLYPEDFKQGGDIIV